MKSFPIAVTAVTFMSFIIIVFMFPSSPNPASATMNYTVVVLGKLKMFSVILTNFLKFTWSQVEPLPSQFFTFIFPNTVVLCGLKDQ